MIWVAQFCIYFPLPLMIDPTRIKYPVISQILLQVPYLFPMKTLLVILPPLMILQDSLYYILMILNPLIKLIKLSLTMAGWKEENALGNMVNKCAAKIKGFIDPRALINTGNFIIAINFPGLVQRQLLASWNINIIWNKGSAYFCDCIHSILYFNRLTRFCGFFLPVPLITPCSIPYVWFAWNFDLVLFLLTVLIYVIIDL